MEKKIRLNIKKPCLYIFAGALLINLFFASQASAAVCLCSDGISSDFADVTACCRFCVEPTVTFDGRSQSCAPSASTGRTATEVANEIVTVCDPVTSAEFGSRAIQACEAAVAAANQALDDGTPGSIAAAESALTAAKAAVAEQQRASESYVQFLSPIGQISPGRFIGNAIKTVLGIIGAIALAIFVYGGFVWMTSGGSPEKIKTAQTTLVWAVLGMIVMFASYAAVDFVLRALGV